MAIPGGFVLPIRKRGLFAQDSFFQDYQKGFNVAVDDVMDRWSGRSLLADQFSSYRKLRQDKPQEDTIAASISDTKESHVIVIDLSIYVSGEITVRTVERNAVVQATAGSSSFSRKYPLPPDTNIDGVVAALSDEGIMTITVPRIAKKQSVAGKAVAAVQEADQATRRPSFVSSLKIDIGEPETQSISNVQQSNRKFSKQVSGERIVPLVVEGNTQSTAATSSLCEQIIPLNIEESKNIAENSLSDKNTATSMASGNANVTTTSAASSQSNVTATSASSNTQDRVLPIMRRGQFFKDSFFEKVWTDFESAMGDMVTHQQQDQNARGTSEANLQQAEQKKEVVKEDELKMGGNLKLDRDGLLCVGQRKFNRLNSYRNLRDWADEDDNQAGTVTKEATCYKIVLDVHKFVDGKLDVQAIAHSLEIKGQHGDKSFSRKFSLPGMEKPDKVTADLSTDGVLTVTAPL